jgi:hypothetical protein
MKSVCKGTKTDKYAPKFASVMEIWNGRMYRDLETYGTIDYYDKGAEYRVKILFEMIDIFTHGCPHIDVRYMSLLANVFLMHLREVWKQYPAIIGNGPTEEWNKIWDFLANCGVNIANGAQAFVTNLLKFNTNPICDVCDS